MAREDGIELASSTLIAACAAGNIDGAERAGGCRRIRFPFVGSWLPVAGQLPTLLFAFRLKWRSLKWRSLKWRSYRSGFGGAKSYACCCSTLRL